MRKLIQVALICTASLPILLNAQTTEAAPLGCLMNFSSDGAGLCSDENQQLIQILAGAYQNSLMHDSSEADLEANDLLLETASIEFASRLLDEEPAEGLNELVDSVSYAAYHLENLSAASVAGQTKSDELLNATRLRSMEHLYRMVFALSQASLDPAQSEIYLQTASGELRLARRFMQSEEALCACDAAGYETRAKALSQLAEHLEALQKSSIY